MSVSIDTKNKSLRVFLWLVLILYMIVLVKFVLFKKSPGFIKDHFLHHYSFNMARGNFHPRNFHPFHTIKMYTAANMPVKYAFLNLGGNFAGFIPLAILIPLLSRRFRSAIATILFVFLLSFCFEIFQLISLLGVCDIDDLMLNTLGGVAGYFIFWLMTKFFPAKDYWWLE